MATVRTYKDALGRTVKTVWDNGTPADAADDVFSQTLYGVGQQPVPGYAPPAGQAIAGQQVVKVEQRRAGDPAVATVSYHDAAG